MSDTPRTDAKAHQGRIGLLGGWTTVREWVEAEDMRKLERELSALQHDNARLVQTNADLATELTDANIALCSLTPGGSEYVNDPAACVTYVRNVRESQHEGWISVKDRLPTHIHSVLVYVTDGPEPYRDIGIYNNARGQWQVNDGDDDINVEVSHWMPLPAAPFIQERQG